MEQCPPLPLALEVPVVPRARCQCLPCHSSVFLPTWSAWGTHLPHLQRSLAHASAQPIVLAVKHGEFTPREKGTAALESRMRILGIGATIVGAPRNSLMRVRYFSLVKLLYEKRGSATQWIALLDDDTFLPSMRSLVETLGSYDSSQEWFLGGISEDWWLVMVYGMMSFGGGGIFLSITVAPRIDANHDTRVRETYANQGDIRSLSVLPDALQPSSSPCVDSTKWTSVVSSPASYESGRLPLLLHDWKAGWHFEQKPEQRALNT